MVKPPAYGRETRRRAHNVGTIQAAEVRLKCGHEHYGLPAVSCPVGRADLYVCPQGCGLVQGTKRRSSSS